MPDFSSKNEGVWFYFDPEDESLGGVCLRELSTEEYDKIERMTVKVRRKVKRGAVIKEEDVDKKLASKMRWDYCIVDWKNVSLDGHELQCNVTNKVKMMKVLDFAKHVADSIIELTDANKTIENAKLKNSESSSNGKLKSRTVKRAPNSTTKED